jgi:hypothetical protein
MQSIKFIFSLLLTGLLPLLGSAQTNPPGKNFKVIRTSEAFFPDGDAKLYELLNRKIIFTDTARALIDRGVKIDSVVLLSFYVETDSSISDMTVLQDVGYEIGYRLAEFVKTLRYAPGQENNIPVRTNVVLSMPIKIK